MATISRAARCAVLALPWVTPVAAQRASSGEAIRAQVRGFYRDDRDHRWPDVLDHFWVGKITARWTAPTSNPAWVRAHPVAADSACGAGYAPERLAMAVELVEGRWARVFVTRSGGRLHAGLW